MSILLIAAIFIYLQEPWTTSWSKPTSTAVAPYASFAPLWSFFHRGYSARSMEGRCYAMPTTNKRALQNCHTKLKDTPHEKWREQCDSPTNPPTNDSADSHSWQHLPSVSLPCTAAGCIIVAMWFYNLFLKVGGFSFNQWSKATTKQWCKSVSSNATWNEAFVDSYD